MACEFVRARRDQNTVKRLCSTCWWLLPCLLLGWGCARYQLGSRTLYPPHIRTVYVPVFESDSYRRYLGERLTEAVIKQIDLHTPYQVVDTPTADSILTGRIISEGKRVLVENPTDEPRQLEVAFVAQVSWLDQHGQLLAQQGVDVPAALVDIQATSTVVPEVGQSITTAQQSAIDQLATEIVSLMESPW